jgi:hypothetical protein
VARRSSFDFQRQIYRALARELSRVRQCSIDIQVCQRRVAPQYLFARYTCRNVIHYDGHKDTCFADARSAVTDGRVYADSLAPILYTFILTRFSPQRIVGAIAVCMSSDLFRRTRPSQGFQKRD